MEIKETKRTFSLNKEECSKNDLDLFKSFRDAMKIHCIENSELICELRMGEGKEMDFSHEHFLAGNSGNPHWVDLFVLKLPETYGGMIYKIEPPQDSRFYFTLSDYGGGRWNVIETEKNNKYQFQKESATVGTHLSEYDYEIPKDITPIVIEEL